MLIVWIFCEPCFNFFFFFLTFWSYSSFHWETSIGLSMRWMQPPPQLGQQLNDKNKAQNVNVLLFIFGKLCICLSLKLKAEVKWFVETEALKHRLRSQCESSQAISTQPCLLFSSFGSPLLLVNVYLWGWNLKKKKKISVGFTVVAVPEHSRH